jgi:hypothetical protein
LLLLLLLLLLSLFLLLLLPLLLLVSSAPMGGSATRVTRAAGLQAPRRSLQMPAAHRLLAPTLMKLATMAGTAAGKQRAAADAKPVLRCRAAACWQVLSSSCSCCHREHC